MGRPFYMPQTKLPGLTSERVLKTAFELLVEEFKAVRIPTGLPDALRCTSLKYWDEDSNRSDRGYMHYPNLYGFPNDFVLGVGEHFGDGGTYMAADIYGFKFLWKGPTDDLIMDLRKKVARFNDYTRVRAPLVALFTGQFAVGAVYKQLIGRFKDALEDCITYPEEVIMADVVIPEVRHSTSPYVRYTPLSPEKVARVLVDLVNGDIPL